nr:MAG TPA: hypothetical protein [Caudoviricetes sp.]
MSKSVLVIDAPENCYNCPFGTEYYGSSNYDGSCELAECLGNIMILITEEQYDYESKTKPDWCPLKPLPDKMKLTGVYGREYFQSNGKMPSYKIGWNDCIDEITGGNSDD